MNELPDHVQRMLSGDYVVHGDAHDASCTIALPFGKQEHDRVLYAGISNEDLGVFIQRRQPPLPVFTTPELAMTLEPGVTTHLISDSRTPGNRLDTFEFLQQVANEMELNAWQCAVMVGHPNHLPWADHLCRQLGIETVVPAGLDSIRFDPHSSQAWTRNLQVWQDEVRRRTTT